MSNQELQQQLIQFNAIIENSLSNSKPLRDQASKTLLELALNQETTTILLHYISSADFAEQNRVLAAVCLKNIIKKVYGQHNYSNYDEKGNNAGTSLDDDEIENQINQDARNILQNNLVTLLMSSTRPFAQQYLEIISLIGKRYVQNEWPSLIPELVEHIKSSSNPVEIGLALEAFKKICKKYRYMFRSDALYTEINYVIENLSVHLLNQAISCVELAKQNSENEQTLKVILGIINSCLHIIESLLGQEELPDFYEESLEQQCIIYAYILDADFPKLQRTPDELVKCRAKVVRLINIYSFKFSDSFQNYLQGFFEKTWNMVCNNKVPATKQNEKLIQAVVRYLNEMLTHQSLVEFFRINMMPLFTLVILPNISLTEDDIDEYQDEPEVFIRNDLEESDFDTRRRQCMKFVQALTKRFPQEVNSLITDIVGTLLADYAANRNKEWLKKSTVLNMIITASISQYTYRSGAQEILIDQASLAQYLEQLVMVELQEQQIDNLPILKATCIKFIYMFRNQLPDQMVPTFVNLIADFMKSESTVNQSYAAACIEKLLLRKSQDGSNSPLFTAQNVDINTITKLLSNVCQVLNENKNLYAMRALFRLIQLAQLNIIPFAQNLGQVFGQFIREAAKEESQSSPNYLYILFEATALTIRYIKSDRQAVEAVEEELSHSLNFIIESNATDLVGYAFQIYAVLVACSTDLKNSYKVITQSILTNISNWHKDMKYLIPALNSFLIAMIFKYPSFVQDYTNNIKDIIHTLMGSDIRMEHVALSIGTAMFEKLGIFDEDFLKTFLFEIFTCLHYYRNNTKTKAIPISITMNIMAFFGTFMINIGTDNLVAASDTIQKDILFMVLGSEGDKLKNVTAPSRSRRYTIIGFSKLLSERAKQMPIETVQKLCSSLVELCVQEGKSQFQVASTISSSTEDVMIDGAIDQTFAFQRSQFIALNSAKIEQTDKLEQDVPNAEQYFLNALQQVSQQVGATSVTQLMVDQSKHLDLLQRLCNEQGVSLT